MRREYTVKTYQGMARRRHEGDEPRQKLQWRHHAVGLLAPGLAQGIGDASIGKDA
jgi:hypothetical protein